MTKIERKFSVFISSSYKDLIKHREKVHIAILREGNIPVGMEMFGAGISRNTDTIDKYIKECDVFVIIVGARLGSKVSKQNAVSYIEWEYNRAAEYKKPILAFLLETTEYKKERDKIGAGNLERAHDSALNAFRSRVQETHGGGKRICEFFSYKDDPKAFANVVSRAVSNTAKSLNIGGWVPGYLYEELFDRVKFDNEASQNPFFNDLAERLNKFTKLSKKTNREQELKKGISDYFWHLYLPNIKRKNIERIYFDSGSSIAFLSRSFIEFINSKKWTRHLSQEIQIATNNILTFLDFILMDPSSEPISIHLIPEAPIEPNYGASFGRLTNAPDLLPPTKIRTMDKHVKSYYDEVTEQFLNFFGEHNSLILLAASGIDLSENSEFPGPHVGSYYNKLIKRSLISTKKPIVLFIDESKLDKQFIKRKCYSICDPDFLWSDIIASQAFAIAVATHSMDRCKFAINELGKIGLENYEPVEPIIEGQSEIYPTIIMNDLFKDIFDE